MGAYSILYVDDEPQNLYLFRSLFQEEYIVHTAASGSQALEILAEGEIQVILADQRMPGINGVQLLESVAAQYPQTVRVLVTGYADIDVVIDAINRGAVYRYLSKPWDIDEIKATIRNALEVYELKKKNQTLIGSLRKKIEELNFLNQLQLDLKGLRDQQSIIAKALDRLQVELQAESSGHCGLERSELYIDCTGSRTTKTRRDELQEIARGQELQHVSEPVASELPDGRGLCVLPLLFQGTSFGHLLFLFTERQPFASEELPFAEAASHIVSSVLYSQHLHNQEMKKEQFLILGQMASMIVHDLKGPLATILGFVSLLQAELAANQRREFAGIINQEVQRLIEMVEELLAFSKGQSHLERSPIDVPELFREVMELFAISLKKENIQTELSLDGCKEVSGDRKKLKQVFINLLQNAREYLQRVEGERTIQICSSVENGQDVIRFINNGPPIPKELLPKLFDPFFSYKKDQGTGLGLTICRKIVEEHGGTIEVRSRPGENEFRIALPGGSPSCPESKNHSRKP